MMRIDSIAFAWITRGWLMLLAFTVALLVIALLRQSVRRLFGAERVFQLWLLPPLAMICSQLPHAASATTSTLSTAIHTFTLAARAIPAHVDHSNIIDWRTCVVALWLAGIAIAIGTAVRAQSIFRSRMLGATRSDDVASRWPVLYATTADVGPALVGAWRARIVLPSDFHDRYDATERALILAHEAAHADRRDGWWSLLAQIIVAVFWFHPMAWLALAVLRHDQELACDAAVMRKHGAQRRSYASAMLKTLSAALALPVGCLWSPRHPMTERIAMLKWPAPGYRRRLVGIAFLLVVATSFGSMVYAANQSIEKPESAQASPQLLQIAMRFSRGAKVLAAPTICVKAGELASVSLGNSDDDKKSLWTFNVTATPQAGALVKVDVQGSGSALERQAIHFILQDSFDKPMVVKVDNKKSGEPLQLSMTPTQTCAATNKTING